MSRPVRRPALPALVTGLLLALGTASPAAAQEEEPRFDRAAEEVTAGPGTTFELPGGFTNGTGRTLGTVYVRVDLGGYLSFTEEFGNCWYEEDWETLLVDTMTCRLRGTVRPGRSYDLDLGTVKVDNAASREQIDYVAATDDLTTTLPDGARRGSGPTLAFTERARPDEHVRPAQDSPYVYTIVRTGLSRDLAVNEVTLRGKPGDVVEADFYFVNNGPGRSSAVFDDESDNDTARVVELTVPPGVKAVDVPTSCRGRERGFTDQGAPGAAGYTCVQDRLDKRRTMPPGQFEHFPFAFRIERADGRAGEIRMPDRDEFVASDADLSNNSAAIKVDVTGAPAPSRGVGALLPHLLTGGLAAAVALGGGALWLRRRSAAARTSRETR